MKLEAVTVCINYSDFLKHVIDNNKKFFDKWVIVTTSDDRETQELCKRSGVLCEVIHKSHFAELDNKGFAVNQGLKKLDRDGWVLHIDADIWLPPLTRSILERFKLKEDCIYGVDRFMCESFEDWKDFIIKEDYKDIHSGWVYLETSKFRLGKRMVQYYGEGYWVIGYFQLWNPKGSNVHDYPETKIGYDRDDVLHMKRWCQGQRILIPDFIPIHLSSQKHENGQNWYGRNSPKFGDDWIYDANCIRNTTKGEERKDCY